MSIVFTSSNKNIQFLLYSVFTYLQCTFMYIFLFSCFHQQVKKSIETVSNNEIKKTR